MFPLLRRLVLDENGLHRAGSQASIQMSEPEEVMVRGHTFGLREEQECDRKKQGERTGAPVHHARSLHKGTSDR